jgi:putative ABC transport system permease protein
MDFINLNMTTSLILVIVIGLCSQMSLMICFSAKHRLLWTLGIRNLLRNKRNTALMMTGLLIGSAIITSSLVVGDSLNATIQEEAYTILGETDIRIRGTESGFSQASGLLKEMSQELVDEFHLELLNNTKVNENMDGFYYGRTADISLSNPSSGLVEPSATWWAADSFNHTNGPWEPLGGDGGIDYIQLEQQEQLLNQYVFIMNRVLAEDLGVNEGENISLSFTKYDLSTGFSNVETIQINVWKIVEMDGSATVAGSKSPVLFSTLKTAQEIQDKKNKVNFIDISGKGGPKDSFDSVDEVFEDIKNIFNDVIKAKDVGFLLQTDFEKQAMSVSLQSGDARLTVNMIEQIEEIVQDVSSNTSVYKTLQAQLFQVRYRGDDIVGILGSEINSLYANEEIEWYSSSLGVSIYNSTSRKWTQFTFPEGMIFNDFEPSNYSTSLIAHTNGITKMDINGDSLFIDIPNSDDGTKEVHAIEFTAEGILLAARMTDQNSNLELWLEEDNWTKLTLDRGDWDSELFRLEMVSDDSEILIRAHDLFGFKTCRISQLELLELEEQIIDCNWGELIIGQNKLIEIGGLMWDVNSTHSEKMILMSNASYLNYSVGTLSNEFGMPLGSIIAAGCDGVWIKEEQILYVWNSTQFVPSQVLVPNGAKEGANFIDDACIQMNQAFLLANEGISTISRESTGLVENVRFPLIRTIESSNLLPLLGMAVEGQSNFIYTPPKEGEFDFPEWVTSTLEVEENENISFLGVIPYLFGTTDGIKLSYSDEVGDLPKLFDQPGYDDLLFVSLNMTDAEEIAGSTKGERSSVVITGYDLGNETIFSELEFELNEWMDKRAKAGLYDVNVRNIKQIIIETSEEASENVAGFFLVFGSFTVVAGILLVVNIFVMLADERKSSMGMLRALGMQRPEMRAMFVFEGSMLSVISSAVGAITGIFIAFLISLGFQRTFSSVESEFVFYWSYSSLIAGFAIGFLITWITLWITSWRNSRLNVVAALRDLPTQNSSGFSWLWILVSLVLFSGSIFFILLLFILDSESELLHASWMMAGYLMILGLMPIVGFAFYHFIKPKFRLFNMDFSRSSVLPKLLMSICAISLMLWTGLPESIDPIRGNYEETRYSFIPLGIFSVTAGVLILTSIAPAIARVLGRTSRFTKRFGPVIPTALAYPLSKPLRSSLVVGMFSLTIFSVVVLAGFSAQFEIYSSSFVDDAQGEFELLGTGSLERPLNLEENKEEWPWPENITQNDFDAISVLHFNYVRVSTQLNEEATKTELKENVSRYIIRGIDENFASHEGLPLIAWDESLGVSEEEIWSLVSQNEIFAIVDSAFAVSYDPNEDGNGVQLGDVLVLHNNNNLAMEKEVIVVGVLKEGSLLSLSGIFVQDDLAEQYFGAEPTRIMFSIPESKSIEERVELSKQLETSFVDYGMQVYVIEEEVLEIQSLIFAIFSIFKAFLALGLVVGIAGLGVVTMRAVSERQHQTGVLRALGFDKGMILFGYILELTWISLLGMINGVLVAILFHYQLYQVLWAEQETEFIMPWTEMALLVFVAYLLVLIFTALPIRKASNIHPAEALRDVV